jgi:hypothetical protein
VTGYELFYCVRCNRLEELEGGDVLFKTGYFRVVHPLGCCESCRAAASEEVTGFYADFLAAAITSKQERLAAESRVLTPSREFARIEWAAV